MSRRAPTKPGSSLPSRSDCAGYTLRSIGYWLIQYDPSRFKMRSCKLPDMISGGIPAPVRRAATVVTSAQKDGRQARRPHRGRPRSEEADRAILSAAVDVLADKGLGGMSMEEVAARAGVGKATVYRRWSSKLALAHDALLAEMPDWLTAPDTGTLNGDLYQALSAWIRFVNSTRAG